MAPGEQVAVIGLSSSGRWRATGRDGRSQRAGGEADLTVWDASTWRRCAMATNIFFDIRLCRALAFSPDEKLLMALTGHALGRAGELLCFRVPSLEPVPLPPS